jgi:hypothetical protein
VKYRHIGQLAGFDIGQLAEFQVGRRKRSEALSASGMAEMATATLAQWISR